MNYESLIIIVMEENLTVWVLHNRFTCVRAFYNEIMMSSLLLI